MAIQINPNQPIVFNRAVNSCLDEHSYTQITDQTDTIQFQVEISPCAGSPQLCLEPSFDEYPISSWYTSGITQTKRGELCHEAGTWAAIEQNDIFEVDGIYQVTISVQSIFGEIKVFNEWTQIGTVNSVGDTVLTFRATSSTLRLRVEENNSSFCLTSITAYQINEAFLVAIRNADTDAIVDSFTLASDPDYFIIAKNTLTVSFPWSDFSLQDGCYYISVDDACNNVCGQLGLHNQEFIINADDQGTLTDTGWSESGTGTAYISGSGMAADDPRFMGTALSVGQSVTVTNDITQFCAGKQYTVSFNITNVTNNGEIFVTLGGTDSSTYTTTGVKTFNITATNDGEFSFTFASDGFFATNISITDLTVTLTNASDYSFQYDSEPMRLATHTCSLLINISNDNDAFGFVFVDSGFAPRIRLDGTIRNSTFPSERSSSVFSDGSKKLYHALQRKKKELALEPTPEYVHNFLALMCIADHLFIDGTEYFAEDDEPNITYPNTVQDWGSLLLIVSEKQQTRENKNVGNPSNPISASEGYIVHPTRRLEILTEPSTGDTVEAL